MKRHKIVPEEVLMACETPALMSSYAQPRRVKTRGVVKKLIRPENPAIAPSSSTLINMLEEGLPVFELEDLQESLDIPMEKLMDVLGIAKSTLHRRRKGDQRLDTLQSDRVIRFARLMRRAVEVFESEPAARQWLQSPQFGLGGAIPLKYAQTEVGAREVEELLGRIDHTVYS
jgi:putative toxin-antitoxin system antitoxin component (TIGR02293 family)